LMFVQGCDIETMSCPYSSIDIPSRALDI
jgi:hypothetical protein